MKLSTMDVPKLKSKCFDRSIGMFVPDFLEMVDSQRLWRVLISV
jgi:hypothetical protein